VTVNSRVSDENIIAALRNEVAALKRELTLRQAGGGGGGGGGGGANRRSYEDDEEGNYDENYDDNSNDDLYQQQQHHQQHVNDKSSISGRQTRGGGRMVKGVKSRGNMRSRRKGASPRTQMQNNNHNSVYSLSPIDEGLEEMSPSPPPDRMSNGYMGSHQNESSHTSQRSSPPMFSNGYNNHHHHPHHQGEAGHSSHHPQPHRSHYEGGENLNGYMNRELSPRGESVRSNVSVLSSPELLTTPALQYQVYIPVETNSLL
jgi:hypothetical protein